MDNPDSSPPARRTRIFLAVFALASVASLSYVLGEPPVYVASARVQVGESAGAPDASALTQSVQTLTGTPVLENAWTRLGGTGNVGTSTLGGMLSARPVAGSSAIELRAEGADRQALPRILTAWMDAWREVGVGRPGEGGDAGALEEVRGTAERLAQDVATRRAEIEAFRVKFAINAQEPAEHPEAPRLKELEDATSQAAGREADSGARLKALRESLAAGQAPPGTAPAAAELERQASEARLAMKKLEQDYTALYLAHDPRYNALRSDLARLEQGIEQEKQAAARQAVQKAEAESAAAKEAASRAQEELAAAKRVVDEHTARVGEHATLAGDLTKLEESHAAARERLAQLDKERAARMAGLQLTVLTQPVVPEQPDRPVYWRDGLLAVTGSAALGLIAAWFAGLRQRGSAYPSTAHPSAAGLDEPPGITGAAAWLPAMTGKFSRELASSEVQSLWRAAGPEARIVAAGLLNGLSPEELAALRYEHVDFDACYVRVPGVSGRSCTLRDPLRRLLAERRAASGGMAPLADARGEPLAVADLDALVARAAQDAGLADASHVTLETLRYTYFAFLVKQGARFAELGEFIGRLSPAAHREYGLLAPPGAGRPMEEIDPVYPVLRDPRH